MFSARTVLCLRQFLLGLLKRGSHRPSSFTLRPAFTLVEVLMAMFVLVLFPVGALITTIRLEQNARTKTEEMAASAFCENLYIRCVREEKFTAVSWKALSGTVTDGLYASLGISKNADGTSVNNKIYLPVVRLKNGEFYSPLAREGYQTPKYRIVNQGTHDVRVSLRWGPKLENYYHK